MHGPASFFRLQLEKSLPKGSTISCPVCEKLLGNWAHSHEFLVKTLPKKTQGMYDRRSTSKPRNRWAEMGKGRFLAASTATVAALVLATLLSWAVAELGAAPWAMAAEALVANQPLLHCQHLQIFQFNRSKTKSSVRIYYTPAKLCFPNTARNPKPKRRHTEAATEDAETQLSIHHLDIANLDQDTLYSQ